MLWDLISDSNYLPSPLPGFENVCTPGWLRRIVLTGKHSTEFPKKSNSKPHHSSTSWLQTLKHPSMRISRNNLTVFKWPFLIFEQYQLR
ncbi:hypothetical protein Ae201684_005574 [Aphanomyces euteiches]|uniref:Uncharacterized protein n=1 Tax=Aphanomyces euteiches TaxID=100861 RepID=A0A6G0XF44_9STRA|nr:hypothetical protein Ae201684_005574 [Aphanomyces euteiches]